MLDVKVIYFMQAGTLFRHVSAFGPAYKIWSFCSGLKAHTREILRLALPLHMLVNDALEMD